MARRDSRPGRVEQSLHLGQRVRASDRERRVVARVGVARAPPPDRDRAKPMDGGARQVVHDDAEAGDARQLTQERDRVGRIEMVEHKARVGDVERAIVERAAPHRRPAPVTGPDVRSSSGRNARAASSTSGRMSSAVTDSAGHAPHVRSRSSGMSAAPVPTSSTEIADWGQRRSGQLADRAAAQVDAAEPAVDPGEVAQVAAQCGRIERTVEQFRGAVRASHASAPRSTAMVVEDARCGVAARARCILRRHDDDPHQGGHRGPRGRASRVDRGEGTGLVGPRRRPGDPLGVRVGPEARDLARIRPEYGLFINGREVPATGGETFVDIDPSTEQPLAQIAKATPKDVDRAVRAARQAFERRWGNLPGAERAKYLYPDLADPPGAEPRVRRPRVDRFGESRSGSRATSTCRSPRRTSGTTRAGPTSSSTRSRAATRVPLGVAGQIIPWNFPLLMLAWKIAPALAAGNTVVLKPASTTPLSALLFAEVCREAGLPPGVVNIITGPGDIGTELVRHRGVDKIAFTGSTGVGKHIARTVAGSDKALTLELGGKAANIVFDDAPLDQAIEGIVNGIYFNQGEVCCAGSRLLVQESVQDELIDRLKDRLSTIRVGDPLDKNTDVGAINSRAQLEKITELVAAGQAEGADLYQPACDLPDRGYFFRPTLFTNVAQSHRIAREEIFGPVLSVLTFRTPSEAVEKANNTPFGLSAGIWTEKGSRILHMVRKMKAGVVWANTFNRFDPTSPFGGYKESGYGREGGLHGLLAYVRLEDG